MLKFARRQKEKKRNKAHRTFFLVGVMLLLGLILAFFVVNYLNLSFIVDDKIERDPLGNIKDPSQNWNLYNNSVYVDDNNVFISVTPHTLITSDYIQISLISKQYSGDIDFLFGIEGSAEPSKAEIYNPREINTTRSLTCPTDNFDYTLTPEKRAWCIIGGSDYPYFNRTFEWGSIQEKTIYWNESKIEYWRDFNKKFTKLNYEYQGVEDWYYIKNLNVQAGETYTLRSYLEIPINSKGKYWVAIKPSGETLQKAIQSGHLYYLDPWWNSTFNYKKKIEITENSGSDLSNYSVYLNITKEANMRDGYQDIRFVNGSEDLELSYWVETNNSDYAMVYVKVPEIPASSTTDIYMYYGNADAETKSSGEETFILFEGFEDGDVAGWTEISGAQTFEADTGQQYTGAYSGKLTTIGGASVWEYNLTRVVNDNSKALLIYSRQDSATDDGVHTTDEKAGYDSTDQAVSVKQANPNNMIGYTIASSTSGIHDLSADTWYKYEFNDFDFSNNQYDIWINNVENKTDAGFRHSQTEFEYYEVLAVANMIIWIDNLALREFTPTQPTYSVGAEQEQPVSADVFVSLVEPANNSVLNIQETNFSCYGNSTSGLLNLTLWINDTSIYTITNTTATQNITLNYTTDLGDGDYNYTCQGFNAGNNDTAAYYFFTIDTTDPNVTILAPDNSSYIPVFSNPADVNINVSATGSNYCWYQNATGNTTLTCGDNITQSFTQGWNEVLVYANDTAGNIDQDELSFFVNFINYSVVYQSEMIEGRPAEINLSLTATDINNITANLTWTNLTYVMTGSDNGTYANFRYNYTTPLVDDPTDYTFNISYILNSNQFNTTTFIQTITSIQGFSVQAGACSETALTFYLKDEQNQSEVNGSIQYNFNYGTIENNTLSTDYGEIKNIESFNICINSNQSQNWSIGSGQIFYTAPSYVERRYYVYDNTQITNKTQNITLYNLLSGDQTSFKLEVESSSLSPYSNKFTSTIRWYPDLNSYNVVEMGNTDDKGETILHVDTEDVDYRIGVYERDGTLIYLANPIRMVCETSPCTYTLQISPTDTDYTNFLNIDYDRLTYNSTTGIWRFVYSDSSQETTAMNLTIWKMTGSEVYSVCSSQVNGYSGAVTCNSSAYSGTLKGVVTRSASPAIAIDQKIIETASSAFTSTFGLFLSLVIGIPIAILFAFMSPIAALVGGVISLLPALYFKAINWVVVASAAVLAGIVAHFIKRVS